MFAYGLKVCQTLPSVTLCSHRKFLTGNSTSHRRCSVKDRFLQVMPSSWMLVQCTVIYISACQVRKEIRQSYLQGSVEIGFRPRNYVIGICRNALTLLMPEEYKRGKIVRCLLRFGIACTQFPVSLFFYKPITYLAGFHGLFQIWSIPQKSHCRVLYSILVEKI